MSKDIKLLNEKLFRKDSEKGPNKQEYQDEYQTTTAYGDKVWLEKTKQTHRPQQLMNFLIRR